MTLIAPEPGSRIGSWSLAAPEEAPLAAPRVVHVKAATPAAIYIGRAMPKQGHPHASDWANEFKPASDRDDDRRDAIRHYVIDLLDKPMRATLHTLAGQELACWCAPRRCHGDALAELIALIRFAGSRCPHCGAPVLSYLNWHWLGMTEAWRCAGRECQRGGHRRRPTPPCLNEAPRLL